MAEFFDTINDKHREFIAQQPIFFVSTAASDGRINLSPKGYDVFRILGQKRVAYLDLGGSGNETQAHINAEQTDKGRITIMFCNFQSPALILRIYGKAVSVMPGDNEWDDLAANFDILPGTRQIFNIMIDSIQTSCGWGVPHMELQRERATLIKAHDNSDGREWLAKNELRLSSIDGLPQKPPTRYFGSDS